LNAVPPHQKHQSIQHQTIVFKCRAVVARTDSAKLSPKTQGIHQQTAIITTRSAMLGLIPGKDPARSMDRDARPSE
jgi:hypothetical protein